MPYGEMSLEDLRIFGENELSSGAGRGQARLVEESGLRQAPDDVGLCRQGQERHRGKAPCIR